MTIVTIRATGIRGTSLSADAPDRSGAPAVKDSIQPASAVPVPDGQSVLVLGAGGLLGSHLIHELGQRFDTFAPRPSHGRPGPGRVEWLPSIDGLHPSTLEPALAGSYPDVIVNCVARLRSSADLHDAAETITVNAVFPHHLAMWAREHDVWLIHISTDGVFSGGRGRYVETDEADPVDLYGRSKLLGEVRGAGCLTLRTSFFGLSPRGTSLMDWLFRNRSRSVNGYTRAIFTGLPAPLLAQLIGDVIARPSRLEGLYHVGGEAISKCQLLSALSHRFGLRIDVQPTPFPVVDRSLDSARFWDVVGARRPSLDEALRSFDGHPCYIDRS